MWIWIADAILEKKNIHNVKQKSYWHMYSLFTLVYNFSTTIFYSNRSTSNLKNFLKPCYIPCVISSTERTNVYQGMDQGQEQKSLET